MATRFQITIDCRDPGALVRFWAEALGYRPEAPPEGHASWNDYWRTVGVPEAELDQTGDSCDSVVDPAGAGPRIWFQVVPELKRAKNRVHLDLDVGGGRGTPAVSRRARVDAEADRLGALGATVARVIDVRDGEGHYAVVMSDPEGNEFCLR